MSGHGTAELAGVGALVQTETGDGAPLKRQPIRSLGKY